MITDADVQNLQIDRFSFLDLLAAEIPGNIRTGAVRKPHPRLGAGGAGSGVWTFAAIISISRIPFQRMSCFFIFFLYIIFKLWYSMNCYTSSSVSLVQ
jgi:hypothetical protein